MIDEGDTVYWVGTYWTISHVNLASDGRITSLDVTRMDKDGKEKSARVEMHDFTDESQD